MIDEIKNWLQQYPFVYENLKFAGILLLSFVSYFITKKVVLEGIHRLVKRTKTIYDDILFNDKLLKRLSLIVPLVILNRFSYLLPSVEKFLSTIFSALIIFIILLAVGSFITALNEIYEKSPRFKDRPIKGYLQVVKIIIYVFGVIILIGIFTGQSPWALVGGLGALTAVLLLIFRDTILSFVASIQISSYDLVKVGDWIEVPNVGADGDVIDISLNVIKVQNWDKTITVIPTYKLIENSFKNWRGMTQSGGRRIMRAVYLDQSSIKFCDEEMLKKFQKFHLISGYIKEKLADVKKYNDDRKIDNTELVNGRRLTNVGTFRAYLKAYLKDRKDINQNLTFLVRQLPPGPTGLPIEIYVFANTTAWGEYEDIQSDIFDHILSVIPQFELSIFQNPTGSDFRNLNESKHLTVKND